MNNLWFNSLNKSVLTPPPIVFKIVWGILYVLILASFVIYLSKGISKQDVAALSLFILNIIFNVLWCIAFFVMHDISLSLIIVGLMIVTLVPAIILFARKSKVASSFLIVYLVWLIFAFYLNYELLIRN